MPDAKVSSQFVANINATAPNLVRKFWIIDSDYSERVVTWPRLERRWNEIRPVNLTIKTANHDGELNLFRDDKVNMRKECEIQLGVDRGQGMMYFAGNSGDLGVYSHQGSQVVSGPAGITISAYVNRDQTFIHSISNHWFQKERNYALSFSNTDGIEAVLNTNGSGWNRIITNVGLPSNRPHLLAVTYNGSEVIFYRDAVVVATASYSGSIVDSQNANLSLMHNLGIPALYKRGSIADIRVWRRALPESEIQNFYNDLNADVSSELTLHISDFNIETKLFYDSIAENTGELLGNVTSETLYEGMTQINGTVSKLRYKQASVEITIIDKLQDFSSRTIGTNEIPVDFTASDHLVSDLVWYLCTSYGGFSALESWTNPDIDYESFLEWAAIFSGDTVLMQGYFKGERITDVLRRVSRITQSAIYVRPTHCGCKGKLSFKRFSLADSAFVDFDNDNAIDITVAIDDLDIVNRQQVGAAYDVESNYHTIFVTDEATPSVNTYGLREDIEDDKVVWYANSNSAQNLAQRITLTQAEPYDKIQLSTGVQPIALRIGEAITVEDSLLGIAAGYRVMGYRFDINKAQYLINADRSYFASPFTLDVSALDSTDVLT